MSRFRRRLFAWLAFFATLIGALAPTVSQAMISGKDASFFIVVCSAMGTHQIEVSATDAARYSVGVAPDSEQDEANLLESCPYCVTHAGSFGLPARALGVAIDDLSATAHVPHLFLVAPRPLFAWTPSHPRAPPFLA